MSFAALSQKFVEALADHRPALDRIRRRRQQMVAPHQVPGVAFERLDGGARQHDHRRHQQHQQEDRQQASPPIQPRRPQAPTQQREQRIDGDRQDDRPQHQGRDRAKKQQAAVDHAADQRDANRQIDRESRHVRPAFFGIDHHCPRRSAIFRCSYRAPPPTSNGRPLSSRRQIADTRRSGGGIRHGPVRLHHRRRGLGGRRAGGAAERESDAPRSCCSRPARASHPYSRMPHQLRPADRQPGRQLALPVRARARHRQPRRSRCRAASCSAARARSTAWSGCAASRSTTTPGRRWARAAGAGSDVAPLFTRIENFVDGDGTNGRGTGGPLQGLDRARPEPALRRAVRGREGRRLQAQPRLQQRGPGRRRQDADHRSTRAGA